MNFSMSSCVPKLGTAPFVPRSTKMTPSTGFPPTSRSSESVVGPLMTGANAEVSAPIWSMVGSGAPVASIAAYCLKYVS